MVISLTQAQLKYELGPSQALAYPIYEILKDQTFSDYSVPTF